MAKNYIGITDTGKMRKNNEDTFIAEPVRSNTFIAACVIDGVGGYAGGEVAAQLAKECILDALKKPGEVMASMLEAFTNANEKIYSEKKKSTDNDQMACVVTLALADIEHNKFYYVHVGDTRLYLLRDNTLVKITKDHSFVGFLEDSGRLTEEAAMRHPKRNEINKALGFDASIAVDGYVETGDSPFLPGDVLLLCSDGLTDMVSNSAMSSILNSGKTLAQKANELVDAANNAGGKDNITVVLVHNDKSPLKQEATKPAAAIKKNEEIIPSLTAKEEPENSQHVVARRRRSSAVPVLSVLCLLLLGAFLWLLYQGYDKRKQHEQEVAVAGITRQRNTSEQKLLDSIERTTTNEVFLINTDGEPIVITESILIKNDTLHIIGNGSILVRDSAYHGPALGISSACKHIIIDSLTLENFDVGIFVQNRSLQLNNVVFKNCKVPVQYQFLFPADVLVTGGLPDSSFFRTDTLVNNL